MNIVNTCIFILIYFLKYYVVGTVAYSLLKKKILKMISMRIVSGFIIYQALFWLLALPLILLKSSLTELMVGWCLIFTIILIYCVTKAGNVICKDMQWIKLEVKKFWYIYLIGFLCLVGIFMFTLLCEQHGLDVVGYLGIANTSYATDTMWQYYRFMGTPLPLMPIRRILSTFEINSAVCCKLYGLQPILEFRIIRRAMNIVLTTLCYWYFGKHILKIDKKRNVLLFFVITAWILNVIFSGSIYTNGVFMLTRTYEGKAFCGNCVALFILMLCVQSIKEKDGSVGISILFMLTGIGSIAVSASSMYLVFLAIVVTMGAAILVDKRLIYLKPMIIGSIPSVFCLCAVAAESYGLIHIWL